MECQQEVLEAIFHHIELGCSSMSHLLLLSTYACSRRSIWTTRNSASGSHGVYNEDQSVPDSLGGRGRVGFADHRSCQDFARFGHTRFARRRSANCNTNAWNRSVTFAYSPNTMPPPSNTLLIEGSFSELAEELSQYVDNVAKLEDGAGLRAQVEPSLATIREAEQSQEPEATDGAKVQAARDDLMKKIVTKASVLNSAPEKGIFS